MARIIKEIEIEGKKATALFDTGAYNSYVLKKFVQDVPKRILPEPYHVGLGGRLIEVKKVCIAIGRIEGLSFDIEAVVIDEIGKADGKDLDAIIGVLVMEKWEIKLNPKTGELDLEGLRRREFTEYLEVVYKGRDLFSQKGGVHWMTWAQILAQAAIIATFVGVGIAVAVYFNGKHIKEGVTKLSEQISKLGEILALMEKKAEQRHQEIINLLKK